MISPCLVSAWSPLGLRLVSTSADSFATYSLLFAGHPPIPAQGCSGGLSRVEDFIETGFKSRTLMQRSYYTNTSTLLGKIMLCGKLYRIKVFKSKPFSMRFVAATVHAANPKLVQGHSSSPCS